MLESIVGFLAKVAFWAFLVGMGVGVYLGAQYSSDERGTGVGSSCVAPAPEVPAGPG